MSIRSDRANLIEPFQSYMGVEVVESLLSRQGLSWKVLDDNNTVKEGESRPPFRVYILAVENFQSFGFNGVLVLQFFNNRLLSTSFYPESPDRYKEEIQSRFSLGAAKETRLDDKTVLKADFNYEDRFYVRWEDVRLSEELTKWIMRYA